MVRREPLTPDQQVMVVENLGLARKVAGRIVRGHPRRDFDDVYAGACIGLMLAVQKFDPARGCAFSTLAWPWVREYAWIECKRLYRRPPRFGPARDKGESMVELAEDRRDRPPDAAARREAVGAVRAAVGSLARRHADVIRGVMLEGRTFADVAESLGVTRQRAEQIHRKSRPRLQRRLAAYCPAADESEARDES